MLNNYKNNILKKKSPLKAIIFLKIKANSATAGPPLSSTLGQYGIPAGPFCNLFNERTSDITNSTILNVSLFLTITGEYKFNIMLPTNSFFFKKSLALKSGLQKPGNLKSFLLLNEKPILSPYMVYEIFLFRENIISLYSSNPISALKTNEGSLKSMGFQILNF